MTPFDLGSLAARLARVPRPEPSAAPASRASVAAILRQPAGGAEAEILLIRRAEHEHDPWSGHMAFPGGRKDEGDPSLFHTAVRETHEEVGIDLLAHGELLAELPELPAIARGRRTGLVISPFVFALARDVPIRFDPAEVAEVLWVPFGALARREGAGTLTYEMEGHSLELPCLNVRGRVVWGLTYRMLEMLFEALG